MIVVTGATGKLGHHVIESLLKTQKPENVVAAVRNPQKADAFKKMGVGIRQADYSQPSTWAQALKGATRVLLISSNEIGKRFEQHKAVIDAARAAGVKQLAYTSILRADTSVLGLAKEHLATEEYIKKSGVPSTFLRNGWYLENHTENLASALEHGVIMGAAGQGRFSSASRADFAAAAAAVLSTTGHENKVYELAGDTSFTLNDLAQLVAQKSGRSVVYKDLPASDYEKALTGFGLPQMYANLLADSDVGAAKGDLYSDRRDLSKLIGRPTTTLATALDQVLRKS